jgi:hypothetical protein
MIEYTPTDIPEPKCSREVPIDIDPCSIGDIRRSYIEEDTTRMTEWPSRLWSKISPNTEKLPYSKGSDSPKKNQQQKHDRKENFTIHKKSII